VAENFADDDCEQMALLQAMSHLQARSETTLGCEQLTGRLSLARKR
jgi:hypothetical protein